MIPEFRKPTRPVDRIFIHCSASDAPQLVGKELVDEIRRWHLARGFADVGYHFLIDKLGEIMPARPLEAIPAAQEGHNLGSIAICVHGLEDFTPVSLAALSGLCREIDNAYSGGVTFHGHREVNPHKSCPVFDYKALLHLDAEGRLGP